VNEDYKAVRAAARLHIEKKLKDAGFQLTTEDITKAIAKAIDYMGCDDVDKEDILRDLESAYNTHIGTERVLLNKSDANYEPWLEKRKSTIAWRFWDRYYEFLRDDANWPTSVLGRLDAATDKVLGLLTAPDRPGSWDRRGMIVGHVQSGKTANYTGLICKAADAGYKVIVVLAGFHNSLRSQTQVRLDEGFLGYSRVLVDGQQRRMAVGVGNLNGSLQADSITTRSEDGDFRKQVADHFAIHPGGNPLLFVVKKNKSVLTHLLSWVDGFSNATDTSGRKYLRDVPLLVIDDEADQGSIDTKKGAIGEDGLPVEDHNPVELNKAIRRLLRRFDQSAYVGYTATPFANIFIHEDAESKELGRDLFPRSFIVALPTPSNYLSPAKVFGYESEDGSVSVAPLPICRDVVDYINDTKDAGGGAWMPPQHKKDHIPRYQGQDRVPPSLSEAIRAFVLACAARLARGQDTEHNSMLVHVTRFTDVQNIVKDQVERELTQIQQRLRYGDGDSQYQIVQELQAFWENDFEPTTESIVKLGYQNDCAQQSWSDVEPHLVAAALSINVRAINGTAREVLDYVNHKQQGLNVIAIGGDKLSRGLTLEGLTVSYFLRASRMYDTLMQMGRWFGYRPGYLDLCRLYTTTEMTEWFAHIAAASEELRDDFNRMEASGSTPEEFGHRVRSHPALLVTSAVKMRHGQTIDITFQGDISETINFWRSEPKLKKNWEAATNLFAAISKEGKKSKNDNRLWIDVSAALVLRFLADYNEHPASKKVKTALLADYIRMENKQDRLTTWSVLIATGSSKETRDVLGEKVALVHRGWHLVGKRETHKNELIAQGQYRIRRIVSPADEGADLDEARYAAAMTATKEDWTSSGREGKQPKRPSGFQIRRHRFPSHGLLIIYLLDPHDGKELDEDDEVGRTNKVEEDAREQPIVGFAISFPQFESEKASKVRYTVGNIYYKNELLDAGYEGDLED
jgi:hypothetical protein